MFIDSEAPMNDCIWETYSALVWATALTTEVYRDTGFIMQFMRHNQADFLQQKTQINHQKKLWAAMVDFHVHLVPMWNTDWSLVLSVQYAWINYWQTIPAASWRTDAGNVTIPLLWADQYKHLVKDLLTNVPAPANETPSSIFLIKITRVPASDTYEWTKDHWTASANVWILFVDAHVPTERFWGPLY